MTARSRLDLPDAVAAQDAGDGAGRHIERHAAQRLCCAIMKIELLMFRLIMPYRPR